MIVGLLMLGRRCRRRRLRLAAGSRRRRPDRPAAHARLRAAAARGRRRLAGLRDHDQQCRGRRLPRTPRRQPAARDDARAVHRARRAGRWLDRLPARRAPRVPAVRRPPRLRRVHDGARAGRAPPRTSPSSTSAPIVDRGAAVDDARPAVGRGLPRPEPGPRRRRRDRCRGRLGAARDRRRDHQGAAHAPVDGRAAAGRDRHQQPDDRDHRGGQHGHLRDPRRRRPVRRRPDRDRRVRRRDGRLAAQPPRRLGLLRMLFVVVLAYTAIQMLLRVVG